MTAVPARRPVRSALLFAALMAAVAALAAAAWVRHARGTPVAHVTIISQNAHAAVTAPDCPAAGERPCTFGLADATAFQTVLSYFRNAKVLDAYAYNPPGRGVRLPISQTIRVRTAAGVVVSVVGRCVSGGGAVRDSASTATQVGPAVVAIVDGRQKGCSVAVVVEVPAGIVVPLELATHLAHDSRIGVAP